MRRIYKIIKLLAEINGEMAKFDFRNTGIREIRLTFVFPALIRMCNMVHEQESKKAEKDCITFNRLSDAEKFSDHVSKHGFQLHGEEIQ